MAFEKYCVLIDELQRFPSALLPLDRGAGTGQKTGTRSFGPKRSWARMWVDSISNVLVHTQ